MGKQVLCSRSKDPEGDGENETRVGVRHLYTGVGIREGDEERQWGDIPLLFKNILHFLSAEITGTPNLGLLCNQAVSLVYEFVPADSDFWKETRRERVERLREGITGGGRCLCQEGGDSEGAV